MDPTIVTETKPVLWRRGKIPRTVCRHPYFDYTLKLWGWKKCKQPVVPQDWRGRCKQHGGCETEEEYRMQCVHKRIKKLGVIGRHLTTTLREALAIARKTRPEEALSLLDEVELSRLIASESLNKWELAQQSEDPHTRALANSIARDALTLVADMVHKAARVRALFVGSIDYEHLDHIALMVADVVAKEVQDPEAVARIVEQVRDIKVTTTDRTAVSAPHVARGIRAALAEMDELVPPVPSSVQAPDAPALTEEPTS